MAKTAASGGTKRSMMLAAWMKLRASDRWRRSQTTPARYVSGGNHFSVSVTDQMQFFTDAPLSPNMRTQMCKRFSERALTEQHQQ
jgi:hypothetical protein